MARGKVRLESALHQLELQIEHLIDAYQHGALSVVELKARRERLEAAREVNRLRIEELEAQNLGRARLDRLGDDLAAFAAMLRDGLDELDFHGRQRLIRLLIERVVVTGNHVAIEHVRAMSSDLTFGTRAPGASQLMTWDFLLDNRCRSY